ncbi:MAG: DNA cytosine methyltransferase [Deltaproteobacteria bacterium]|nr:DNA cytosine methyltransferase [Deltaproteobacteria bacterium]
MPRFTAIDLFSGAGGISLGLHAAGFDVLLANDWDVASARSYRRNFPKTPFIEEDIRKVSGRRILAKAKAAPREVDLLVGGPPCQGFSIIGARVVHDERNDLFRDFLRIGEALKPRCMVIENVTGLATLAQGAIMREILDGFRQLGYTAGFAELLAAQYGVPQMRWRMVFVGFRKDLSIEPSMGFPKPTHGSRGIGELIPNCTIPAGDMNGFITTREAIGDLPPVGPGKLVPEYTGRPRSAYQHEMRSGLTTELYNHYAPKLSPKNMARISALKEGQDWRDLPRELLPEGMRRALRKDHTRRYSRMTWSGVPRSIITRFRDPKSGEYTHPEQDRTISIREAARIQSFPDRFAFEGSYSEQYDQVGNAVPPKLAAAIALEVKRCLEGTATYRLKNAFARRPSISQARFAFDAF